MLSQNAMLGKAKHGLYESNSEGRKSGRAARASSLASAAPLTQTQVHNKLKRTAYLLNHSSTLNRPPPRNIRANALPTSATLYSMPWPLLGSFAQFKKKPLGK